ncbi:MAG: MFS transporter [Synergistaceae bacterium]|jgi:sugar phosphate permease|nr:MFS transporter [Synergistaceae bacterium]
MTIDRRTRAAMMVIGSGLSIFSGIGAFTGTFSMYVLPLSVKLNVSTATIGLIYSFVSGAAVVLSAFLGQIIAKIGISYSVCLGALGGGLGFIIVGFAKNIYLVYLCGVLLGFATIFTGFAMAQTVISKWFATGRATLFGVIGLAEALGTTVFAFIAAYFFGRSATGFETSAVVTGVIVFILCAVSGLVFMHGLPEDYGFKPIGAEDRLNDAGYADKSDIPGISSKEALKTARLWILMFATFILVLAAYLYTPQQAAYLGKKGLDNVQVALFLSSFMWAKVLNKLLFGIVSDKCGMRLAIGYNIIAFIAGYGLLLTSSSFIGLLAGTIGVGMGSGMSGNYGTLVIAKMFGAKDMIKLAPMPHSAAAAGGMVGPLALSAVFSISNGSFPVMFITAILLLVVFLIMVMSITRPSMLFEK